MGYFHDKRTGDRKWTAGDEEHDAALGESGVGVDSLSRVSARPTEWFVQDVVPDEGVTLVTGEPGVGKTFFACQLAADAARELQYRVVLATSGYESPQLIRWRLEQAEGDARRVALAELRPRGFTDRRGNPTDELIDERLAILYYTLEAAGDPTSGMLPAEINGPQDDLPVPRAARLLVIDDVDGWFGKPGNMLSPAALARVVQRLNELARAKRVAIVVLARLQMSVEGRITTRQLSRLSHAASVVWMVVRDREKAEGRRQKAEDEIENPKSKIENPKLQNARRWFLPVKNNLSSEAATFARTFEIVDGRICWRLADPPPALAEALLPSIHNTERRSARKAAAEWLAEALADGPVPSKELYQQAIDCGHSKGTVQRAAEELGIRSHKTGFNGGWEMRWTPKPVVRGRPAAFHSPQPKFRIHGEWEEGHREQGTGNRDETLGGERESGRGGEGESGRRRCAVHARRIAANSRRSATKNGLRGARFPVF